MKTRNTLRQLSVALLLAAAPLSLAACDDGPAEETGEAIDEATEDAAEDVEDAADELRERQ